MVTRTVRIRAVFRPDDPDCVCVLRIAAVANDLDTLARVLQDQNGKSTALATIRYALRMAAVHISDIVELLNHTDFERVVSRVARRRDCAEIGAAAAALREAINQPALRAILSVARNGFAAHYDAEKIKWALEQVGESELMDLPGRGARHNVLDRLFDISLADTSHKKYKMSTMEESVKVALDALLDLQAPLVSVIQILVAGFYFEAEGF